jgi:hypothetical protein
VSAAELPSTAAAAPFDPAEAVPVLARTPVVLRALLDGLPEAWIRADEGQDTWNPFDVIGHLVHGERTDWIPRAEIILAHGEARTFDVFDRFAMLEASQGKSLGELLETFTELRAANVERLVQMQLAPADLERRGRHPELGTVTLGQHLATWVVHDLSHIAQVARVMGKRYREAAGPWRAYLPMLQEKRKS